MADNPNKKAADAKRVSQQPHEQAYQESKAKQTKKDSGHNSSSPKDSSSEKNAPGDSNSSLGRSAGGRHNLLL